ncbi:MAG TPA: urease accessory protein UreD [Planctomycetota bacterium]|nr:urease accessory protein UreD [Planctomycetota bacterium]
MEQMTPGIGRLRFESVRGKTAVVESFAASPLKFVQPNNHGSAAWVFCSTYGGGLLGGDAIDLSIDVGAETQAVLMTQASTKVYRSDSSARQTLACRIANGALFAAAPDRVACFAGSSLQQTQRYTLAADANLAVVDWISAGRLESGERWQFERYASRIEIWRENRLNFLDALLLDAAHGPLPKRMNRFNTLATVALIGPKLAPAAAALLDEIAQSGIEKHAYTRIAASPLGADGAVIRLASVSVEALGARLRSILRCVCDLIGDDPWARRW